MSGGAVDGKDVDPLMLKSVKEKGVSSVEFFVVILYAHNTLGCSSTHLPLASSSLFFKDATIVLFVNCACSFNCVYLGVENDSSSLCCMEWSGYWASTTIEWHWKYGLSFLPTVTSAKASFSSWFYLVYASKTVLDA
uniref:Uncharacterized protein n=1 Tax=Cannabis sativa TaxID=3483 RepID=A0A803QBM0_CANSA